MVLTTGGVPWASWVTYTLIQIQSQNPAATIDRNSRRIDAIREQVDQHSSQLQVIAATRFTAEQGRMLTSGLEVKIDRMADKIDATNRDLGELRREFDRNFGSKAAKGTGCE